MALVPPTCDKLRVREGLRHRKWDEIGLRRQLMLRHIFAVETNGAFIGMTFLFDNRLFAVYN